MGARETFSKTKIKNQLNRILSTPAFKNSRVLSGFLEFVVDKSLAGKDQEIKEYSIGINVLSLDPDFNPQLNGIVRIHAGRLRRALKEYYHESGKEDPILIEIPKGSYIPLFQSHDLVEPVAVGEKTRLTSKKPVVAVFPFRNINKDGSRDFFADGLGEQLSTELSWFHDLSVISYHSSRHVAGKTSDAREAALLLGAKYILTGSIQNDDTRLRIWVQLILGETGEQLWTRSFEKSNTASGLFEIQNEIVRSILTAIGGYYGAISRDVLKAPHSNRANGIEIYDAIFLYYHYQKVFTKEILQKTIIALEAAVKADPDYAIAWAMLGELYLDEKVIAIKTIENPAEEALNCALRAVTIDPACQHGYMAMAWIYLFHHKREESLEAADKAMALNPNAADVVGAMGFVLTCAGEFDRGFELLNDCMRHNPYFPWWFNVGFMFYFLSKKKYEEALTWAKKVNRPDLLWDPMMKAAALGHLNRVEEAGRNLELLHQIVPDAGNQVKDIIGSFILSKEVNEEILEGLRKAGLNAELKPAGSKPKV